MNQVIMPTIQVGNEFVTPKPNMKVEVLTPEASLPPQSLVVAVSSRHDAAEPSDTHDEPTQQITSEAPETDHQSSYHIKHRLPHVPHVGKLIKHHRVAVAALIILVIGSATIMIGGRYYSAKHIPAAPVASAIKVGEKPVSGLNLTVPAAEFQAKLESITHQPATLTVGDRTVPVSSDTIRDWLQVTTNKNKSEYYIHLNRAAIAPSVTEQANEYVKTPVNQVTVTEDGADRVVVGGRNGTALSDPNTLNLQAQDVAKTIMDGKGVQFSTPLATVPFQSVTAANFDKLLVSDINRKKMWAFQNGQLVKTFLVSAGAPATPTPVGQFKVRAKLPVQDMRGYNADGSRYLQPRVPWVSYFYGDNAVHGVYWRPASWFGAINSSHGCIGTMVDEAKWVYDWAPIGTTVIVHT